MLSRRATPTFIVSLAVIAFLIVTPLVLSSPGKIYIWGFSSCPACQAAETYFRKLGVPYLFIDVSKHGNEFQKLVEVLHYEEAVPVIVFVYPDGSVSTLQGFEESSIGEALSATEGGIDYSSGGTLSSDVQEYVKKLSEGLGAESSQPTQLPQTPAQNPQIYAIMFGKEGCDECDKMLAILPYISPFDAYTIDDPGTREVFSQICSKLGIPHVIPLTIFVKNDSIYVVQGFVSQKDLEAILRGSPVLVTPNGTKKLTVEEQKAIVEVLRGGGEQQEQPTPSSPSDLPSTPETLFVYSCRVTIPLSVIYTSVALFSTLIAGFADKRWSGKKLYLLLAVPAVVLLGSLHRLLFLAVVAVQAATFLRKGKEAGLIAALASPAVPAGQLSPLFVLVTLVASATVVVLKKFGTVKVELNPVAVYSFSAGFGLASFLTLGLSLP